MLDRLLDEPGSDRTLATIRTYLANGSSVTRTAEELHVHPNTVKYRMRKVEKQPGLTMVRMVDLMELQIAILIHNLDPARFDAERHLP